ncbi:MAG TPA: DUF4386 domain-containing protein [Thermoanaerobaculia bacterium]|jgi:hypothetical protein|nr:DUF4386 domain-containing protein [Thermoanaerobaculia bacterium]
MTQQISRIAGFFYLLVFVAGLVLVTSTRGLVAADPATTAANILAHGQRFWAGYLLDLVSPVAYIVVTGLFYVLFAPVNKPVSAVAAVFSTIGCSLGAIECFLHQTPYNILTTPGVDAKQAQTLAFLVAKVGSRCNEVALIFFGCYCLLIGYLIFKSSFLPRAIGVLMMIAGLGWMTFAYPPLARPLIPYIFLPGIIGEGALTFWLLAFGARFKEQA